jgi:hypothetical protein
MRATKGIPIKIGTKGKNVRKKQQAKKAWNEWLEMASEKNRDIYLMRSFIFSTISKAAGQMATF